MTLKSDQKVYGILLLPGKSVSGSLGLEMTLRFLILDVHIEIIVPNEDGLKAQIEDPW